MEATSKDVEYSASHMEVAAGVNGADKGYTVAGDAHHKDKKERLLVLKQDLSIVLLLSGCYWFAYLVCATVHPSGHELILRKDRGALGNARIMGFQKDLGLSASQFYDCLMMFCE